MVIKRKNIHVSVFAKLFCIFVIIILPLYLLYIQMSINAQNDVRKEIAETMELKINFYMDSFEKNFEDIIFSESKFIYDNDIALLIKTPNSLNSFENAQVVNSIRTKLSDMLEINRYAIEGTLFIPSINLQISDKFINEINIDQYKKIRELVSNNNTLVGMVGENNYINITPDFINPVEKVSKDPTYIVSVKISNIEMEKILENLLTYKNGGAIFISNKTGLKTNGKAKEEMIPYLNKFVREHNNPDSVAKMDSLQVGRTTYVVCYRKSSLLNTTLIAYIPEEQIFSSIQRYKRWIWIISICTVGFISLFSLLGNRIITRPLNKLASAFKYVEEGKFEPILEYKSNDEFKLIYERFDLMCERLKNLIKEVYEEKIYSKNAELKQLQYQINPHFLYNSFFMISRMAYIQDYENIERFTKHLGSYYEFVTHSNTDEVPFNKEVRHAMDYIKIQTFRFGERIKVQFDEIPAGCEDARVIRLILQPILENSYSHGMKNVISDGLITINMNIVEKILKIIIQDNGKELDELKLEAMRRNLYSTKYDEVCTGLINVHRRLEIRYGVGIHISIGELGGLCVEINIPLEKL